jgi:hypothetical protein
MNGWVLVIMLYVSNPGGIPDSTKQQLGGLSEEKCRELMVLVAASQPQGSGRVSCYNGAMGEETRAGFVALSFFGRTTW